MGGQIAVKQVWQTANILLHRGDDLFGRDVELQRVQRRHRLYAVGC
jgi:hypothetical protein